MRQERGRIGRTAPPVPFCRDKAPLCISEGVALSWSITSSVIVTGVKKACDHRCQQKGRQQWECVEVLFRLFQFYQQNSKRCQQLTTGMLVWEREESTASAWTSTMQYGPLEGAITDFRGQFSIVRFFSSQIQVCVYKCRLSELDLTRSWFSRELQRSEREARELSMYCRN